MAEIAIMKVGTRQMIAEIAKAARKHKRKWKYFHHKTRITLDMQSQIKVRLPKQEPKLWRSSDVVSAKGATSSSGLNG